MIISLENFDEHGRNRPIINSPRSIEACRRQGIEPEELLIKTLEQIKHLYKDGINDKKSLQIKLQHYEMRRKNKLEIVRRQRLDIVQNIKPVYRPNHSTKISRVQVIEVEDKLEKKRIMDEVKAEIKQKQLMMKQIKIAQKLNKLQQQRQSQKLKKECQKIDTKKRSEKNQIQNQIQKQIKINNYLYEQMQKQEKIQRALIQKRNQIEELKRQKQAYYEQKAAYCKELETKTMTQKRVKVDAKFNDLQKRIREKQEQERQYQRNLQQTKRKDEQWRETKKRQVEIQERKRQQQVLEAIMHKENKKEEILEVIQGKKQKYYTNRKEDRQLKEELIKKKQLEDQREIQKRRRILELIEQQQRKQIELQKNRQKMEIQCRRQQNMSRQKLRIQGLKQEEKATALNNQYLIERQKQREKQIEQKQKEKIERERQKSLLKELKLKQADENRKRLEKIEKYQKMEQIQKYNQKMNVIENEKKGQSTKKIKKDVSRDEIQSKIISDHSNDRKRPIKEKNNSSLERIEAIKRQAKQNPIETKQKLKKEQISKLIENLKIQCNKQEFILMKQQEKIEGQREELEKTAENVAELRRLQKIHGVERARFQQRLTEVMKKNQQKVERYKSQLLK